MTEIAVVDCGSNSTRLLVASSAGLTRAREMRITRLSAGVDASGDLSEEAMGRSYDALAHYRAVMDRFGVTRGLLVATSAVRDARNGAQFVAHAAEVTGLAARVLSGEQEAAYSYAGATRGLADDARPTVVLDIGGGSTEVAVRLAGVVRGYSMQMGCVRVTERALGAGVVVPAAAVRACAMIDEQLDRAFAAQPSWPDLVGAVRLVGVAGTVSTLAQLDAGLAHYERDAVHHRRLSRGVVQYWRDRLGALTARERLAVPGMVKGREDVLVAGLFILDAVMARFGVEELLTSEDDILDGVAASLV